MAGRERRGYGRAVAGRLRVAAAPVLTAMLAALVAGCAAAPGGGSAGRTARVVAAEQASGTTITETGSTLLYPLAKTWAKAYQQQHPGVTVRTAGTGSGKGIAGASDGTADIGASDAYLSSGDLVKNPALVNIPLAVSAQTVIYNVPGLPAGSHIELDGQVLAGIYSGAITRWDAPAIKALNKTLPLPPLAIVPVHRSDSSGDTFLFTSYLSTQDPRWDASIGYGTTANWPAVAGALAKQGSLTVLQACATTSGCVAYNGISYLTQAQSDGLGEAALQNSAGNFTLPTPTAISDSVDSFVSLTPPNQTISMIDGPSADGKGYPIVNYEYAVVSTHQRDAATASAIRAFLTWVVTTGNRPAYLDTVGFQRLPTALVTLGEAQIAQVGS